MRKVVPRLCSPKEQTPSSPVMCTCAWLQTAWEGAICARTHAQCSLGSHLPQPQFPQQAQIEPPEEVLSRTRKTAGGHSVPYGGGWGEAGASLKAWMRFLPSPLTVSRATHLLSHYWPSAFDPGQMLKHRFPIHLPVSHFQISVKEVVTKRK